jgi:hypothetical protein
MKTGTAAPVPSKRTPKKNKNFTLEELHTLCVAYVRYTTNSIRGTNQKSDEMWEGIKRECLAIE